MDIIWDFDGTIMDTYPIMTEAFVNALVDMGIDDIEIDDYDINLVMRRHSLGTCLQKYAAHFNIDKDKLQEIYNSYENDGILQATPFLNVDKALQQNIDNGGRNFLLTHRGQSALSLLDKYDFSKYFTDKITKDQDFPRKPDPTSISYLIKNNNISPEKCIMLGDRRLDVDAGHNAGIKSFLFDPDSMINSTGNPELNINNYYDFIHRND